MPTVDLARNRLFNKDKAVIALSLLLVFIWVTWTTAWDTGLYGDNVEQFVWVHSLEWGYQKHPPMPTWLLGAAIHLIGPHSWLTNGLAAICFATTGWLTWLIARNLYSEKIANTAIILWTLQQCFSVSAQIYNHNTVLVMFMAATVYAVLRTAHSKIPNTWWFSAGVFSGCAMLSKYQAALPLFILLVTVLATNKRSNRALSIGLASAGLGFAIVFSPHVYWAISNNFPTLRYASGALESGGLTRRVAWVLTFFVNQVRMVFPLLAVIFLCWIVSRTRQKSESVQQSTASDDDFYTAKSAWMWCLVWAPVLLVIVLSLISASQLRNHWGVQLFQFLPIWIAWRWRHSRQLQWCFLIPAAIVVHALGFTYYAVKQSNANAVQAERRADSAYPASQIAKAALTHWGQHTACPLKIIAGDFEAGMASAFMKDFPLVYGGIQATPWIKQEQILQYGMLYIADMNSVLPADAIAVKKWFLSPSTPSSGKYLQLAVRLPLHPCN